MSDQATGELHTPPQHCQYADGPCDQRFDGVPGHHALFLYGSEPRQIADTIAAAVEQERNRSGKGSWQSWTDLNVEGQIIFCEICKAMRFSSTVVADVTTLNFNLLFEIGFCIGLGIPLIPVRDTTYVRDKREFDELGVLDTLGYLDFTNVESLVTSLRERLPGKSLPPPTADIAYDAPLYVLKGPHDTEGTVQLLSTIKKSRVKFRAHDPAEKPRLSLADTRREVGRSVGVIAHLLSPHREDAHVHNALCAFVAGMAMAQQKVVLMLQEERIRQPIDYRDVVRTYDTPRQIPGLIEAPLHQVVEVIQHRDRAGRKRPRNLLQLLDLGDTAAENESSALDDYFVETGQYHRARQGNARLVIGRKGSGKTAIFYGIRNPLLGVQSRLVIDLRPEGFQFTRLREYVLSSLSPGLQEHTMMAFWHYLLMVELARKVLVSDRAFAQRDQRRAERFDEVDAVYRRIVEGSFDADFSQRLLLEVDRIVKEVGAMSPSEIGAKLTEYVFMGRVRELERVLSQYLEDKDEVWLLVDNLDKGWPTYGSSPEDILIVRALLEATRKLQQRLEDRLIGFHCLVFLRNDIYRHLLELTPDKGKDTAINLEWEDVSMFEDIVRNRVEASTGISGDFRRDVWPEIADSHIKIQDTFDYLIERTMMRPRDLLMFLQHCVDAALNRRHPRIEIEDLLYAERPYSEDMLFWLVYEIADTHPQWQDVLFAFQGKQSRMGLEELQALIVESGVEKADLERVIELLMFLGFLGVSGGGFEQATFAYTIRYNIRRLWDAIHRGSGQFVVHPAFHAALEVTGLKAGTAS